MTTTPNVKIPAGMTLKQGPDGWEVVPSAEPMTKTVAFRLPASMYADLIAFVEAFPSKSWGAAMRWLFDNPRVRAVMADQITTATTHGDLQGVADQSVA